MALDESLATNNHAIDSKKRQANNSKEHMPDMALVLDIPREVAVVPSGLMHPAGSVILID